MEKKFSLLLILSLMCVTSCDGLVDDFLNSSYGSLLSSSSNEIISSNESSLNSESSSGSDSSSINENSSSSESSLSSESSSSLVSSGTSIIISSSSNSSYQSSFNISINDSLSPTVSNYYSSINLSATKATLMNSLHDLIKNHKDVGYNGLKQCYPETDAKDGKIWDMYSNYKYSFTGSDVCGNYKNEGDCWNREHSIPQSWFKEKSPMKSDLFHVYPTDGKVNGMRSDWPYGEVVKATYTSGNGSKLGTDSKGKTVFEPIDEYKGDFARTYFYFATCYMDKSINNGDGSSVFTSSTSYPKLTQSSIDLFLKWAKEDPVSKKEIDGNNQCFNFQHNRNPFIDFPEFAEQIWG